MKSDHQENNKTKKSHKLVGWLVTYQENQRGAYYELREGRSFIANGYVSGERVIPLSDSKLSNPHSVIFASPQQRVEIQDVFSDSGTYVRRSGSSDEIMVSGPTQLEHGDWLRIGEQTKFQLCLINGSHK